MSNKLIYSEFSHKKVRTFGMSLIVATLSFVVFSGIIILFSLNSGLESLSDRMGADLMVVPLGYESGAEGILIKGEPSYFYFDRSVLAEIEEADIDGIEKITPQFYLTSSNQGCCDIPVQFIGIDEATDYTLVDYYAINSLRHFKVSSFTLTEIEYVSSANAENGITEKAENARMIDKMIDSVFFINFTS